MAEFKYEIIKTVAVLSEGNKGWRKELNLISWNDRAPVYDIRDWTEDRQKMGKGLTLKLEELKVLRDCLGELVELS